jgi:CelD/BcsL family acetyltransferase involved in cellulose biosynthesis
MAELTVVPADPLRSPAWLQLAEGPRGSLFTSPPWISAVCETYGFKPESRIALDDAGVPVGGFAWVTIDDVRGRRISSLPFSDRADPLVADRHTWETLFTRFELGELPFTMRCLEESPAAAEPTLRTACRAVLHATPLDVHVDELHGRLSGSARRNIAVAQRSEVRVEVRPDLDAVRAFHRLHVRLRKQKYQLLAQPFNFFHRLWQKFSPSGRIVTLLASRGREVVAGAIFVEWSGVFYYKFGASLPEHLHLRPNDAIYWLGIQQAAERGLHSVDWGLTDLTQSGLVAYKRKWAVTERRLITLSGGAAPQHRSQREFDAALTGLTQLLTDDAVPDVITAQAGDLLYRYFC